MNLVNSASAQRHAKAAVITIFCVISSLTNSTSKASGHYREINRTGWYTAVLFLVVSAYALVI